MNILQMKQFCYFPNSHLPPQTDLLFKERGASSFLEERTAFEELCLSDKQRGIHASQYNSSFRKEVEGVHQSRGIY